jgi:hypothetical protein
LSQPGLKPKLVLRQRADGTSDLGAELVGVLGGFLDGIDDRRILLRQAHDLRLDVVQLGDRG